jgi:hypothetical protein
VRDDSSGRARLRVLTHPIAPVADRDTLALAARQRLAPAGARGNFLQAFLPAWVSPISKQPQTVLERIDLCGRCALVDE